MAVNVVVTFAAAAAASFVVFDFKPGHLNGSCSCDGRNGLTVGASVLDGVLVVVLVVLVVVVRFWYGTFFLGSGLPNGYLNAELLGRIRAAVGSWPAAVSEQPTRDPGGSQTQNPNTPGMVNWHLLFSPDSVQCASL